MDTAALRKGLKTYFGFDDFQVGQLPVIQSVMAGHPTVAVMPTGAGKSLCYQLPAMLLEGITVVVSPLISLMKDQVDALQQKGIAATYLNSSLSSDAQKQILKEIQNNEYRLIYIAPERFKHEYFVQILQKLEVALFAIDEAHCISRWGHDFRPDYSLLGRYIKLIQPARILACTATATPFVRQDMIQTLDIPQATQEVAGFLRENLYLDAKICPTEKERKERLEHTLNLPICQQGSIVIYASTRKKVESFGTFLSDICGADQVCIYHGGMSDKKRTQAQNEFMQGHKRIVVATNAFGMGIDRSDVRSVIHLDLPRTVEGYYQEVGRAGRDGNPAYCLLLYSLRDSRIHHFLIDKSHPNSESLQRVWNLVRHNSTLEASEIQKAFDRNKWGDPSASIRQLIHHQIIQKDSWEDQLTVVHDYAQIENVQQLPLPLADLDAHHQREIQQHKYMLTFVQSAQCRHAHLLYYFGEKHVEHCPPPARCDRCQPNDYAVSTNDQMRDEMCADEHRLFLKALSGVARAEGYFGLYKVADMLGGSKTLTRDKHFLSKLSTYGILKHLGVKNSRSFLQYLVAEGLCEISPRILKDGSCSEYNTIKLTLQGFAVMRSKDLPTLRLKVDWVHSEKGGRRIPSMLGGTKTRSMRNSTPRKSYNLDSSDKETVASSAISKVNRKTKQSSSIHNETLASHTTASELATRTTSSSLQQGATQRSIQDVELETRLKQYRLEQARLRDLPAFTIFSNKVLTELVAQKPYNQTSFLEIKGLGPSKWAQFGQPILKIIKEYDS